jgi:hypothetical protein
MLSLYRVVLRLAGGEKTLSARNYANWDKVQAYWKHQSKTKPLLKEVSKGTVVLYTSHGKVTRDKVGAHNDLLAEFPYLGPPHNG